MSDRLKIYNLEVPVDMENEGVVVLDPTDERAQRVGKAISSPLASDILEKFSQVIDSVFQHGEAGMLTQSCSSQI
jgi:hypothetical protein